MRRGESSSRLQISEVDPAPRGEIPLLGESGVSTVPLLVGQVHPSLGDSHLERVEDRPLTGSEVAVASRFLEARAVFPADEFPVPESGARPLVEPDVPPVGTVVGVRHDGAVAEAGEQPLCRLEPGSGGEDDGVLGGHLVGIDDATVLVHTRVPGPRRSNVTVPGSGVPVSGFAVVRGAVPVARQPLAAVELAFDAGVVDPAEERRDRAGADVDPVDRPDGPDPAGRARDERLFGVPEVLGRERALGHRDPLPLRDVDDLGARDPRQNGTVEARGAEGVAVDEEEVARGALRELAVAVEHHGLVGVGDPEFEPGQDAVDVVVRLRLRGDRSVGDAAGLHRLERRRPVPDRVGADAAAGKRLDLDHDSRLDVGVGSETPRPDAAGDREPDRSVVEAVRTERRRHAFPKVRRREPVVERERRRGAGEALGVVVPAEHRTAVDPEGLEDRVAVQEPAVADAHGRLRRRNEVAVDVVQFGHPAAATTRRPPARSSRSPGIRRRRSRRPPRRRRPRRVRRRSRCRPPPAGRRTPARCP